MSSETQAQSAFVSQLWQRLTSNSALVVPVTIAALVLYWRTAAPGMLPGDSGELQFAAWGFWLAHPTGYPLYLILGGIWQHVVQIGDPAFRMNLFSAFWSALAVGVAFLVFYRVTHARAASVIAALAFAVSPLFWSQATRAEVYALNTFFLALLSLWGVLWQEQGKRRYAVAFVLTFGLSLAHHRTTILLVPAFAALFAERLFALRGQPVALLKRAAVYSLLAGLALLLYLYIPLRTGATPYVELDLSPAPPIVIFENSPRGWLNVVLGTGFSAELGLDGATWEALRAFPNQWIAQLNVVGMLTALFGLGILLWQKKSAVAAFLCIGSLTFLLFNSAYHIGDIADYYTPIYFFSTLALAAGLGWILRMSAKWSAGSSGMFPTIVLLGFFALIVLQNLSDNFAVMDRHYQPGVRAEWARIIATNLPENAILLSNDRDEITPLYYLQLVERVYPHWTGIFPRIAPGPSYENVISLVQRVAGAGRPIFAIKPIPALALRYSVEPIANGLWQVYAITPGLPQHPKEVLLGDSVRVRGYSLIGGDALAGERITLAVQYVPLKPLPLNFTTSIQLFDANDRKIAQGNDHIPGEAEYPSTLWKVGETIQDRFDVSLDPGLDEGDYRIMLRMYEPSSGVEVGDLVEIGTLRIGE